MKQLIQDIIDQIGPRPSASGAEKQAQLLLKEKLDRFCDETLVQKFEIPPKAKFESLKIFCTLFYVSLVLYWFYEEAAFIISLVNAILFLGHFVAYQNWLDFLFPKYTSHNLIGTIEPVAKHKSTVIVSGHIDSAREFIWWFRLKQAGIVMTVLSGFLIALFPVFVGIHLLTTLSGNAMLVAGVGVVWWLFALASPITITMFNIHGKNFVPGAQDNLSGITVAAAVGEYFSKNKLQHTRIKVASFGSEETGLRGSEAFTKKYKDQLHEENALCLNLDGIKDPDQLHIITKEPMLFASYPKPLIKKLEASFNARGISYQKKPIPIGATDGVSFIREGIPAVTIIGLTTEKLDPTYHTRLDVPGCVNDKALEDTKEVLIRFIEEWDKGEHRL